MKYLKEKFLIESKGKWKQIVELLDEADIPNKKRALILLEKLRDSLNHELPDYLNKTFLLHLISLFSFSQFIGSFLTKHTELLENLRNIYERKLLPKDFKVSWENKSEEEFKKEIRIFKNFHMARVILRDILKLAPIVELMRDVTLIHDAILKATCSFAFHNLIKKYGKPFNSDFCIIDMGKGGAFELNYASDIDIMYIYSSRYGKTSGGSLGSLTNHEFFTLLAQKITDILTERTEEGICLNVDLRLRPNGTMGPLCNDFEALENYYTAIARPWERFALLKARPSAGDIRNTGIEFLKLASHFVYRKYVDLTLIEEVLRLKEMIKSKVAKKGAKIDLKLGKGGIREIEFIVQAFQLIYGGKNKRIRSMHTIKALEKLRKWGFLSEKEYFTLIDAYVFLRRSEHMLQITNFRQTQTFHPESEDAQELALKMGFENRSDFLNSLKEKMEKVNELFNKFFPTGESKPISSITIEDLASREFENPKEAKHFLNSILNLRNLTPEEQNKLDVFGEKLIDIIADLPNKEECIKNLLSFLEREQGKVFFFSILSEPNVLKTLMQLLSSKNFFIERYRETPEVLDFMFDPEGIENMRSIEAVEETVKNLKNLKLSKNLEEIRSVLRKILSHSGTIEFMEELTSITDVLVKCVFNKKERKFTLFSVGKYGSREMNINSDLDLLFVGEQTQDAINFVKELKNLGFKVDTRLRPFGEKGELVFSVNYFNEYTKTVARTWEKLAFTRFRFIVGDAKIRSEMERIVEEFLFKEPLNKETLSDIINMRERLEKELSSGKLDVKYGKGGIVDLEFIGYTYQLFKGTKIGNTYLALMRISKDEQRFSDLPELYIKLREADTEKRLYGKIIKYRNQILEIKEKTRHKYKEFMEWMRNSINMQET